MSARMEPKYRAKFDKQTYGEEKDGWTFEVWEEKHHDCCVVCVVRKEDYIAREYKFPAIMLASMMMSWHRGIRWLEKEYKESLDV